MPVCQIRTRFPIENAHKVQEIMATLASGNAEPEVLTALRVPDKFLKTEPKVIANKLRNYIASKPLALNPSPPRKKNRIIEGKLRQVWIPLSIWEIIDSQEEANSDIINKALGYEDQSNAEHRS